MPRVGTLNPKADPSDVGRFIMDPIGRNVPQNVCDEVVAEFKKLSHQVASEYKSHIAHCPIGKEVDISTLPSVSALEEVSNARKQDKYAKRKFGMVPPESKVLKAENDHSKDSYQFISVTQQLKTLFSNENFREAYDRATDVPPKDGTPEPEYRDIEDGSFHKNADRDSIKLIIYSDEFTVSCPIGNKTQKYGIVAVYFAVANLKNRSRLDHIHLALLVHKSHVRRHSWAKVLQPLVDDLKSLESHGISVEWNGTVKTLKGSVALVVGDNLGIHELAGYFCSFHGTNRICRFCHATTSDIQEKFVESDFILRTQPEYEAQLKILEQEGFSETFQKMFGIKERCVFSQLDGFQCVDQMPVDISHDLLEGVALYTINCVFSSLLALRLIDKTTLVNMVAKFPYHQTDTNRPVPPSVKNCSVVFRETHSETLTLIRLLPLMLKHAVEDSDEFVKACDSKLAIVTGLVQLIQLCNADKLKEADVVAMEKAVEEWLHMFHNEFPDFHIKPKFHMLVHYPSQVRKHGPPKKYCTIRFESKHFELKNFLLTSKNRRNVCFTMARKHQLKACADQNKQDYMTDGLGVVALCCHAQPFDSDIQQYWHLETVAGVQVAKCVRFGGTLYRSGDIVLALSEEGTHVHFMHIKYILVHVSERACRLIGERCNILHYDQFANAYAVAGSDDTRSFEFKQLVSYQPIGIYCMRGIKYITTRSKCSLPIL